MAATVLCCALLEADATRPETTEMCWRFAPPASAALLPRSFAMSADLPPALKGRFYPPTAEQAAKGWSQDWPCFWQPHDAFLAAGGHPPSAEQAAKGWTQDWDAWKTAADELVGEDGGKIVRYDFTGGDAVRAAKLQASKETHEYEFKQLKGALHLERMRHLQLTRPLQSYVTSSPSASSRLRSSRPWCSRRRCKAAPRFPCWVRARLALASLVQPFVRPARGLMRPAQAWGRGKPSQERYMPPCCTPSLAQAIGTSTALPSTRMKERLGTRSLRSLPTGTSRVTRCVSLRLHAHRRCGVIAARYILQLTAHPSPDLHMHEALEL